MEQMRAQGHTSIRPEELQAYGIEEFLAEQKKIGPWPIPYFEFTEKENRLMDKTLAEERQAKDHASEFIKQTPVKNHKLYASVSTAAFLLALVVINFPAYAQNFDKRNVMGEKYARQQVQAAAKGLEGIPLPKPLLPTKAVAIATVEPVLFNIYGKNNITRQRPYEAYLIGSSWYISGTLPKNYIGGVFEIIIDANNGRVVYLTHGK